MENSVDSSRPVECYRFNIAGYPELRYTSDSQNQVAEGLTYTSLRGLRRSPFVIVTNGDNSETSVSFPADSELSLKCGILGTPKEIRVTIKRYQRSDMDTPKETFSGICSGAVISGELATLKFPDAFSFALSTKIPKNKIQGPCNWNFGDRNCKFDVESFRANVVSISPVVVFSQVQPGDYLVEVVFPENSVPVVQWVGGNIVLTQGSDDETRTVYESTWLGGLKARIKLSKSFNLPIEGAEIRIFPGCDNSKLRCRTYGNEANFGGFPYVSTERDNPFHKDLSKGNKV